MRPEFLKNLRVRSDAIGQRCETLVRVAALNARLGNAEETVRTIPGSVEAIFAALARRAPKPESVRAAGPAIPVCTCGRNHANATFHAAEQAFAETIRRLHAELPFAARHATDVDDTLRAVQRVGCTAVNAHCETCAHRLVDPHCRFLARS